LETQQNDDLKNHQAAHNRGAEIFLKALSINYGRDDFEERPKRNLCSQNLKSKIKEIA
jgi:hypothetical protein